MVKPETLVTQGGFPKRAEKPQKACRNSTLQARWCACYSGAEALVHRWFPRSASSWQPRRDDDLGTTRGWLWGVETKSPRRGSKNWTKNCQNFEKIATPKVFWGCFFVWNICVLDKGFLVGKRFSFNFQCPTSSQTGIWDWLVCSLGCCCMLLCCVVFSGMNFQLHQKSSPTSIQPNKNADKNLSELVSNMPNHWHPKHYVPMNL